jgi:hypothetical protein
MRSFLIYGADPSPTGAHVVLTRWVEWPDGQVQLTAALAAEGCIFAEDTLAVEDPRGVLFSKTNSLLWSQTCFQAGLLAGVHRGGGGAVAIVPPQDARALLASMAGSSSVPTKDREVRELLQVVHGQDAFDKPLLCPKRNNKSHGADCPVCHGSGFKRPAGRLAELTTPHLRDAFLVAQYVAMGGAK